MSRKTRKPKLIQIALLEDENGRRRRSRGEDGGGGGECVQDESAPSRKKKGRNIKDCENKKEKRYAGYVINSRQVSQNSARRELNLFKHTQTRN